MHVAASTLSYARKPKTVGDDERNSGDGEVIGIEAAAAVMGAAPSGVDRVERTRMPARLSCTSASRFSSRAKSSVDERRSGVDERDGEAIGVDPAAAVMGAAPVGADCALKNFSARLTKASHAACSIIGRHGVQAPAAKTHPLCQSSRRLGPPSRVVGARCRRSSAICPFCRRRGALSQKSPALSEMETPEAPGTMMLPELEISKFIEYPRHVYITICGTKYIFCHHWLELCVPRRPRSFAKCVEADATSKVGHHMSLCGYA